MEKNNRSVRPIIYIHGSNYISAKKVPVQKIIIWFYKILNVIPDYSNDIYPDWLESIRKTGRTVIIFKWSGGVWPWQVSKASRDLCKKIEEINEDVDLISQSLGTWIAVKASKESKHIRSITSVCGVFRGFSGNVPFIEIASNFDLLEVCANFILNLGLKWKTEKIIIPHKKHNEFADDFSLPSSKFEYSKFSELVLAVIDDVERVVE